MAKYDTYYKNCNYFGNPCVGLMEFFAKAKRGTLVDLGAGQGRDSIPLLQMGYSVTAVDISSVGLNQIPVSNLGIEKVLGDLYTFDISGFDYILMDSILHFYKADLEKESALIKRVLSEMKRGAFFVNCLLKNKKREKILKDITSSFPVTVIEDKYIEYLEFEAQFHMFVILKMVMIESDNYMENFTSVETANALKTIFEKHKNERVCVVGTVCSGKTTLIEQLEGYNCIDMDDEFWPQSSEAEIAYFSQSPFTQEMSDSIYKLIYERISVKPGFPLFGFVILDCEAVIYLDIDDDLLEKHCKKRGTHSFADALFIKKGIEKDWDKHKARGGKVFYYLMIKE